MTRAGDFYQESIKDTVRMLEFYGDALVMRHFQQPGHRYTSNTLIVPNIGCLAKRTDKGQQF
jgi:aspartate carbamoyltransferase catalytic subunit